MRYAFRTVCIALIAAVAISLSPRTAMADECTYTWGESLVCWTQWSECQQMGIYTYAQCASAYNACNAGVCLTLHPGCDEFCNSLPQVPTG